jgi:mannose-1-phosphate guanylyltransferase
MKAMILAAGIGTRLRPLTNTIPKALIEINGTPLIEHVIRRLIEAGVDEIIINLHHFPEQIRQFLQQKSHFGIRIEYSLEKTLLDTGGGLKKARHFFDDGKPFILHNVDVISTIDLNEMYQHHCRNGNLATLAVIRRKTSRYLIFDASGSLCGWRSEKDKLTILSRKPDGKTSELGFCGIHVISPAVFEEMTAEGSFSIIKTYLRLTNLSKPIRAFYADQYQWQDVGRMEDLGKNFTSARK